MGSRALIPLMGPIPTVTKPIANPRRVVVYYAAGRALLDAFTTSRDEWGGFARRNKVVAWIRETQTSEPNEANPARPHRLDLEQRPGFAEAVGMLRSGRADTLLVASLGDLVSSANKGAAFAALAAAFLPGNQLELVVVSGGGMLGFSTRIHMDRSVMFQGHA